MARDFLRSGQLYLRRTVTELRGVKVANFRILAYFPYTKPLKRTFRWPAGMIKIFPCGSRGPKGLPSGLRLLVGELGTPKLAQIFVYGKWLYHAECYYTQGSCAGLEFKAGLKKALNFKTLKKSLNCVEKIHSVGTSNNVETSYFTQLKMCYLMTTFRFPSDILITSWLFTAWWSTWPWIVWIVFQN